MKIFTLIIGLCVALLSVAGSAEAYGIYGPYGFPSSYRESTDFYTNAALSTSRDAFSGKQSGSFQNSGSRSSTSQFFGDDLAASGFTDESLQNFLQNININVNDGYSFTKGPCATEVVKGNFRGKSNDFTLTKQVCDGIEGTFFKDNSFANSINNNAQANTFTFGAQASRNSLSNQNQASNSYAQDQEFSKAQDFASRALSASFGRGTRIVLN